MDRNDPAVVSQPPISIRSDPQGNQNQDNEHEQVVSWGDVNRVIFVACAAAALWFAKGANHWLLLAIGAFCTIIGGFPIFEEAFENIVQRRMTMDDPAVSVFFGSPFHNAMRERVAPVLSSCAV